MARTQRLLDLMQILRRRRYPVSGADLAAELGISLRTLYRDIATLKAQGANIEGEPGLGYILRPGFTLPPLMFSEDEIDALVLGSRWVAERSDGPLQTAARNALAKIAAIIPDNLRQALHSSSLMAGPGEPLSEGYGQLPLIRRAIRLERKLAITYRDLSNVESSRIIWPFVVGFFDNVHLVAAWCELRRGFRSFRLDRISSLTLLENHYPRHRQTLLQEWQNQENIIPQ